jgi:type IX secretion system PorP/SprF family membrane protein
MGSEKRSGGLASGVVRAAFLVAAWSFCAAAEGQIIPRYGVYLANGTLLNPAYTGYREYLYANAIYHRQWFSQGGTPGYFALLVDGAYSEAVNLGFQATSERVGLMSLTSVSASYAYRMLLSRYTDLSLGLSLGASYASLSWGSVVAVSPDDPVLTTPGKALPNISAGVYYGSRSIYGGLAVRNLSGSGRRELDEGFLLAPSPRNVTATLGSFIPLNARILFRPSLMWQDDLEAASHIDATLSLIFIDRFWLGVSARTGQLFGREPASGSIDAAYYSAAFLGEVFLTDRLTLSYAYDMGLSAFNSDFFGGHQISLGYYLTQHKNTPYLYKYRYKSHYRSDVCPNCITYGRPDRQRFY